MIVISSDAKRPSEKAADLGMYQKENDQGAKLQRQVDQRGYWENARPPDDLEM